jgi:putative spermidine/putrescine transport system substrate-binding protein
LTRRSTCFGPLLRTLTATLKRTSASVLSASALVATALTALTTMTAVTTLVAPNAAYADETAICYNCPPEWADWASQIKAIEARTGIRVPFDNKNSGQAIAQMMAEQKSPVADVVYLGVSSAFQA